MKKFFLLLFLALFIPLNLVLAATLPVPTIVAVDNNSLVISGLTAVDSDVMIYIDDKFIGSAVVKNENTETGNFYFSALGLLEEGNHTVKAVARDKTSYALSGFSQEKSFNVSAEKKPAPAITPSAVEDKNEKSEPESTSSQTIDENNDLINLEDVQFNDTENSSEADGGVGSKSKLRWNLAIFLLFLFAVIGWIFWVNHELSKEKELAVKKDELNKKNVLDKNSDINNNSSNNNKDLKI